MRLTLARLFLALPLAAFVGCGSGEGPVPVRGTVTYRGAPLPSALVVFMPETPGVLPASGLTDSDGRFELMTRSPRDGAYPGKYRVTITARREPPGAPGGVLVLPTEPAEPLIPEKYFMPDTSGLTAEVPREGLNVDFNLTD